MWCLRCCLLVVVVDSFTPVIPFAPTTSTYGVRKQTPIGGTNHHHKVPFIRGGASTSFELFQSAVPLSSYPVNETSVVFGSSSSANGMSYGGALSSSSASSSANSAAAVDKSLQAAQQFGKTAASTALLLLLDFTFKRVLRHYGISFPASLAGMGFLFGTFLLAKPFGIGETLYQVLQPGSQLLAKWMQVFLLPNLVILPLAPGLGSTTEVCRWKCFNLVVDGVLSGLFRKALCHHFPNPQRSHTSVDS
jgi:putative effector of murein hydrolase LrgA (UPF0299 family)